MSCIKVAVCFFFPPLPHLVSCASHQLRPKWPQEHWDHWLRDPKQHKNRECVFPEVGIVQGDAGGRAFYLMVFFLCRAASENKARVSCDLFSGCAGGQACPFGPASPFNGAVLKPEHAPPHPEQSKPDLLSSLRKKRCRGRTTTGSRGPL